MLDPTTMSRLAFIRYMYGLAVGQSRQPEPLSAVSVLTFHDCCEFFLQLAAEHVGVPATSKDTSFMAYWGLINAKLEEQAQKKKKQQKQIGHDAAMKRLNEARVAFKHKGMWPPMMTIEMVRSAVTGFFEDSTPLIFGIEFGAVSMLNLVACDPARQSLEEASSLVQSGELEEALKKTTVAFVRLLDDYGERVCERFGRYPRFFEPSDTSDEHALAEIEKMTSNTIYFETQMKILSVNLDYRRFQRFTLLTPVPFVDGDGIYQPEGKTGVRSLTPEDCRFCIDFVIDSAIRLQELDFDLQP